MTRTAAQDISRPNDAIYGVPADGDRNLTIKNPATLETVAEVRCHSLDDVNHALVLARTAQREWMGWDLSKRVKVLRQVQRRLLEVEEETCRTVCFETGKPRIEAYSSEVMVGLGVSDYAIGEMPRIFKEKHVHLGGPEMAFRFLGRSSYLRPRPLGVIGIIPAWNYPFGIPFSQAIMAVAAGNAAIIKPSSYTPLSTMLVARLFHEAGAPRGLVQALVGPGPIIGAALVRSGVDRVIFTGSGAQGREVLRQATDGLVPVTLELGGKDPMVILADADMDRSVRAAMWGSFVNAGQTCACVKRILVHQDIIEEFSKKLVERTLALRLGWGWSDAEVSMGPMITAEAVDEVDAMVQRAMAADGQVLCGGGRPEGLNRNYYAPTIISGLDAKAELCQKEIFGPVVVVLPFKDEDEAVQLARDCPYALSASVWTKDVKKGHELAARMPGGTVMVNNIAYSYGLGATPWGGSKESGFGRTHGEMGFAELMEDQHIHVDKGRYAQDVWWTPYDAEKLRNVKALTEGLFGRVSFGSLVRLLSVRRGMKK